MTLVLRSSCDVCQILELNVTNITANVHKVCLYSHNIKKRKTFGSKLMKLRCQFYCCQYDTSDQ